MLTTHRSYATRFPSSLMRGVSGDDPEGGAGSGVLRPRLVTAGSGGPGHRPPGMTTWLRGASLHGSGGNAGDGSEARPPAENRHGGAPRGERPASWDAPRLTRADPSRLARATTTQVRRRRSAAVSLKPMTSQYNLCQLAAIPDSIPGRWPGRAGSSPICTLLTAKRLGLDRSR